MLPTKILASANAYGHNGWYTRERNYTEKHDKTDEIGAEQRFRQVPR